MKFCAKYRKSVSSMRTTNPVNMTMMNKLGWKFPTMRLLDSKKRRAERNKVRISSKLGTSFSHPWTTNNPTAKSTKILLMTKLSS